MASTDTLIVSTQRDALDVDMIHQFLSTSYWAKNIPRALVAKSMESSLCFGLFLNGRQIGFARMITDRATFAYLADVFVSEEFRGRGYGKRFLSEIMRHEDITGLRRILLATKDAHELYRRFGFETLSNPSEYMTIHRPHLYASSPN